MEAASGRASWGRFFFLCVAVRLKPDGTEVHYLHFAEQIAAVTSGDTVHIVGRASKEISALKFSSALIVKLKLCAQTKGPRRAALSFYRPA